MATFVFTDGQQLSHGSTLYFLSGTNGSAILRFQRPGKLSVGRVSFMVGTAGPSHDGLIGIGARKSPQHSHCFHSTICRKYCDMRQCLVTQASLIGTGSMVTPTTYSLTAGNLSSPCSLQITANIFPAALSFSSTTRHPRFFVESPNGYRMSSGEEEHLIAPYSSPRCLC